MRFQGGKRLPWNVVYVFGSFLAQNSTVKNVFLRTKSIDITTSLSHRILQNVVKCLAVAILSVCLFLEVSRFNADTTGADCNRSEGKASVSWHGHQKKHRSNALCSHGVGLNNRFSRYRYQWCKYEWSIASKGSKGMQWHHDVASII